MPDSFTKFRENSAEDSQPVGSGGSTDEDEDDSEDDDPFAPKPTCPAGSDRKDANCINPSYVVFNYKDTNYEDTRRIGGAILSSGEPSNSVVTVGGSEYHPRQINRVLFEINELTEDNFSPLLWALADQSRTAFIEIDSIEEDIDLYQIYNFNFRTAQVNRQGMVATVFETDLHNPFDRDNFLFRDPVSPDAAPQFEPHRRLGLTADPISGTLSGSLERYVPPFIATVNADYLGNTPRKLDSATRNSQLVIVPFRKIDTQILTPIPEGLSVAIQVPPAVMSTFVKDVAVSFDTGGSALIKAVNPNSNLVFFESDGETVIIPGVTKISDEVPFGNDIATVVDYYVAFRTNRALQRSSSNANTYFPKIQSYNGEVLIDDENFFYDFSLAAGQTLPSGMFVVGKNTCDLNTCIPTTGGGPVSSFPTATTERRCLNFSLCVGANRHWVRGGTLVGTPTVNSNPQTVTIQATNRMKTDLTAKGELRFGVFTEPMSLALNQNNRKLKLKLNTLAPIVLGERIVNSLNAQADVIEILPEESSIIVQVVNAPTNRAIFKKDDEIDNRIPFFGAIATLVDEPIYIVDSTLDGGSIELTVGSASELEGDNIISGADLTDYFFSVFPNINDGIQGANFNNTIGAINFSNLGPTPLGPTEFTFGAVSRGGKFLQTKATIEYIGIPTPGRLIMAQDMLIELLDPPGNNFKPGDFISARPSGEIEGTSGRGHIREVFTETISGVPRYFAWIHVTQGRFRESDFIDHRQTFSNEISAIVKARPINAKIELSVPAGPIEANFNALTSVMMSASGQGSTIIQGSDPVLANNSTATVIGKRSASRILYLAVDNGSFDIGEDIHPGSDPSLVAGTITNLNAHLIDISISAAPGHMVVDQDITQGTNTNATAVGIVRNTANNRYLVEVIDGQFLTGGTTTFPSNPIFSPDPDSFTISSMRTATNRFIAHRNAPLTLEAIYGNIPSDFVFTITPTLPDGLSLNASTGLIQGTPSGRSEPRNYTIRGSDAREYKFVLEVKDSFELKLVNGASSYILHRSGMGKGRQPCRVTRAAMNNARLEDIDVHCYLDAGETQLHANGVTLKLEFGGDMCETTEFMPYAFTQYPFGYINLFADVPLATQLNRTIVQRTGECFPSGLPALVRPTVSLNPADINNHTLTSTNINDSSGTLSNGTYEIPQSAGAQAACWFNYANRTDDLAWANPSLNCDDGNVRQIVQEWATSDFCELNTSILNRPDCLDAFGTCADSDGDPVALAPADNNRAGCEITPGNVWTPREDAWVTDQCHPNIASRPKFIISNSVVSCGGNPGSCLAGPAKSIFSPDNVFDMVSGDVGDIFTTNSEPGEKIYSLGNPSQLGLRGNTYLSNFTIRNSCMNTDGNLYTYKSQSWENYTYDVRDNYLTDVENGLAFNNNPMLANPFYTFYCAREGDTKARIRLLIREWDRDFRVTDRVDRIYPRGNNAQVNSFSITPQIVPQNTDTADKFFGGLFNDSRDYLNRIINRRSSWDDMHEIFGVAAPSFTCPNNGDPMVETVPYRLPLDEL
jgi:hypothetical protein